MPYGALYKNVMCSAIFKENDTYAKKLFQTFSYITFSGNDLVNPIVIYYPIYKYCQTLT